MGKWRKRILGTAASVAALFVLYLIGSAIHLFPTLRNPFSETTTERSQPVVLKSIVDLSKYEAASGNFQVVVDISSSGILPSFLEGSDTLFIGDVGRPDLAGGRGLTPQQQAAMMYD